MADAFKFRLPLSPRPNGSNAAPKALPNALLAGIAARRPASPESESVPAAAAADGSVAMSTEAESAPVVRKMPASLLAGIAARRPASPLDASNEAPNQGDDDDEEAAAVAAVALVQGKAMVEGYAMALLQHCAAADESEGTDAEAQKQAAYECALGHYLTNEESFQEAFEEGAVHSTHVLLNQMDNNNTANEEQEVDDEEEVETSLNESSATEGYCSLVDDSMSSSKGFASFNSDRSPVAAADAGLSSPSVKTPVSGLKAEDTSLAQTAPHSVVLTAVKAVASDIADLTTDLSEAIAVLFGATPNAKKASSTDNNEDALLDENDLHTPSNAPCQGDDEAEVAAPLEEHAPTESLPTGEEVEPLEDTPPAMKAVNTPKMKRNTHIRFLSPTSPAAVAKSARAVVTAAADELTRGGTMSMHEATHLAAASVVAGAAAAGAELRKSMSPQQEPTNNNTKEEGEEQDEWAQPTRGADGTWLFQGKPVRLRSDYSAALARVFASPTNHWRSPRALSCPPSSATSVMSSQGASSTPASCVQPEETLSSNSGSSGKRSHRDALGDDTGAEGLEEAMMLSMQLGDALGDASSSSDGAGPLVESAAAPAAPADQGTPNTKSNDEECEATVNEVPISTAKKQRLSTEPQEETPEGAAVEEEENDSAAAAAEDATEEKDQQEAAEDQYLKEFEAAAEQVRVRRASMAKPIAASSFDWFANNTEGEDEVEKQEAVEATAVDDEDEVEVEKQEVVEAAVEEDEVEVEKQEAVEAVVEGEEGLQAQESEGAGATESADEVKEGAEPSASNPVQQDASSDQEKEGKKRALEETSPSTDALPQESQASLPASGEATATAAPVVWPEAGGRVRVWFDDDEEEEGGLWGEGTVTKVTKPRGRKKTGRIYVEYDDGDEGYCDYPEEGVEIVAVNAGAEEEEEAAAEEKAIKEKPSAKRAKNTKKEEASEIEAPPKERRKRGSEKAAADDAVAKRSTRATRRP